jgi:hypothetical protein
LFVFKGVTAFSFRAFSGRAFPTQKTGLTDCEAPPKTSSTGDACIAAQDEVAPPNPSGMTENLGGLRTTTSAHPIRRFIKTKYFSLFSDFSNPGPLSALLPTSSSNHYACAFID